MGVASLVLGIVGLVISFIPCLGMYGVFVAVPGLVLGLVALITSSKNNAPKGLAIAGFICSLIGSIVAGWQYHVITKAAEESGLTKSLTELGQSLDKASKDISKAAEETGKKLNEAAGQAKAQQQK